jgi:hypothetical protein
MRFLERAGHVVGPLAADELMTPKERRTIPSVAAVAIATKGRGLTEKDPYRRRSGGARRARA